jgi:acyl-CoA synthetase (AMP-forming)/AMP-acid ligase II
VPLESLLETTSTKWPDRIAIDFYDRTLTFLELHDLSARAAKGLQTLGVGPGVQVGLHLPNTPHFVICFFAILMAGGRVVNFSPLAAPRELKYQLMDSETRVMITLGLPMLYPQIATLKGTAKFETLVVCSIEDFLPVPIARVFGPAADRMGEAGREVDFAALIDNDGTFQRHPHGLLEDGRWVSGGAPLPMEVLQRFEALTGHSPKEGYGLTETAPLGTLQVPDRPARQGSVGLPAPHTLLEVVDLQTGEQVLPIGEKGEICFRGPQVMKGYWRKPEATKEAFRGGRFHTGDIGFVDQDGFVTLVDRKKDMILSGGFNVFPRNVEEAIYEHPSVAEVTVIGIPDAYRGQSAKAFIVLKPGHAPFGIDELKAFLSDKLAKYEMPVEMEIRASLPKTPVGKLSKKELVAEEIARRQAASAVPKAPPGDA